MAEHTTQSPSSSKPRKQKQSHAHSSLFHSIVTGIGLALVTASIGVLLYDALTKEKGPPEIVLHLDEIQPQRSGNFLVLFRAENRGKSTAADLFVTGELQDDSGNRETSQARFDYVPAQSKREGGLFFNRDPRQANLELRATGFQKP